VVSDAALCGKVFSERFHSDFNHVRNEEDKCVLTPGTQPLPDDTSCQNGADYWYERTAYRLIPFSSCDGDYRLDRGKRHACPGFKSKGPLFWLFMLLLPFALTAVVAYYYYRRSGLARGYVFAQVDFPQLKLMFDSQHHSTSWGWPFQVRESITARAGYSCIRAVVPCWCYWRRGGMGFFTSCSDPFPRKERV
jgi:hypothetical protein